uniref:Mediator of RNA polymerase II transcription subunit 19a n=1 Tax=Kalanchoe fedtschenkoi TaxID=63787 RepID=A0A7N1A8M0_KALFE
MDELRNFGSGPRELTGAVDLINHFKLSSHHDFFCKRPHHVSVSETHYLHNVVGDTEIRKGEGMQLNQLIQNPSFSRETNARIQPFDLDILREAFQLKEAALVDLPLAEKGIPTFTGETKRISKDKEKEKKHRKHKDKDREKDKEHTKHKHRHKDRSRDKDRGRDKKKDGYDSKKNHDKKRKHDEDEHLDDLHKLKKNKHKTSKMDELGAIRVAG